jgi:hypothetical protein
MYGLEEIRPLSINTICEQVEPGVQVIIHLKAHVVSFTTQQVGN